MRANHACRRTDQPEDSGEWRSDPEKRDSNHEETNVEVLRGDHLASDLNGFRDCV